MPLAGIDRVMRVSEDGLQGYINRYYEAVPKQVQVQAKRQEPLAVQMDELWSFVDWHWQQTVSVVSNGCEDS